MPAFAQEGWRSGQGFGGSGGEIANIPIITTSTQPGLGQERVLDVSALLTLTDNGPNGTIVVGTGDELTYLGGLGDNADDVIQNLFSGQAVTPDDGASLTYSGGQYVFQVGAGSGDITGFDMSMPSFFSLSGVPDTNGDVSVTVSYATGLTANQVLLTNGSGAAGLGALTAAHIPSLDAAKITSGTFDDARLPSTVVMDDESNTYSGTTTQDMSGSGITFKPPAKTAATNGEVTIDSTDLEWRASGTNYKAAKQSTSIGVTSPITGGGDLSTNRTIGLGTVTTANGGTGNTGTPTNGQIAIGNGTTAMNYTTITAGSNINVTNGTGTITISSTGAAFGGNGADGAVVINSTPVDQDYGEAINATSVTITNAGDLYLYEPSPCYINSQGDIDIDGSITLNRVSQNGGNNSPAIFPAGDALIGARGGGIGGGTGGVSRGGGAGGSGATSFGGYGGYGNGSYAQQTPRPYSYSCKSGGGGSGDGNNGAAGQGGSGLPSCFMLAVGTITLEDEALLFGEGQAGYDSLVTQGGGGGGGAAPNYCLFSQQEINIVSGAQIVLEGGAGGNAGSSGANGGGGGGGGGSVLLYAPTVTNLGTMTLTGGTGGSGNGTGIAGGNGSSGTTLVVIGTPNLPIITWLNEEDGIRKIAFGEVTTHREICRAVAKGDIVRYFQVLCERTTAEVNMTCIGIGDGVKVLDNAA